MYFGPAPWTRLAGIVLLLNGTQTAARMDRVVTGFYRVAELTWIGVGKTIIGIWTPFWGRVDVVDDLLIARGSRRDSMKGNHGVVELFWT